MPDASHPFRLVLLNPKPGELGQRFHNVPINTIIHVMVRSWSCDGKLRYDVANRKTLLLSGKLDLLITVNTSSTSSPGSLLPSVQSYFSHLAARSETPVIMDTLWNLTYFFEEARHIHLRRPRVTHHGLVLPMRAESRGALQCLWAEFREGGLAYSLQSLIASNESLAAIGVPSFDLRLAINSASFQLYKDVQIPYQSTYYRALPSFLTSFRPSFLPFFLVP